MPPLVSTSSTSRSRDLPSVWPFIHGSSGHGIRNSVVRTALIVMSVMGNPTQLQPAWSGAHCATAVPDYADASSGRSSMQNLAQKQLGALVLRVGEEFGRLVGLDDLARVHEDHPVR